MTNVKLTVGGVPFEIELGDGVELSVEGNKLSIKTAPEKQTFIYNNYPWPTYPGIYPVSNTEKPLITWTSGNVSN